MRGPAVGAARLAARDLALIAETLDRAVVGAAQALDRRPSRSPGRKPAVIEDQCRLYLVAWGGGSAVASFELGTGEDLPSDLAMRALDTVIATIEAARRADLSLGPADGAHAAVARALRPLAKLFDHGIETVELAGGPGAQRRAVYDRVTAQRVAALTKGSPETLQVVVRGRLDRLDGHDELAGTLWENDRTPWSCRFRPELEPYLASLWRRWVEVEGRGTIGASGQRTLEVERIRAAEPALEAMSHRFWASPSLDELAYEQGVRAVQDLDELTAVWEDEQLETDPFEEIMAERRRRREAAAAQG